MSFTDAGFKDWKRFHTTLLCLRDADYDLLLGEMMPLFRKFNVTVEELDAASVWLIEDPDRADSKWRSHYGLILQFIRRRRAEKAREREQAERKRVEQQFKDKPMDFAAIRAAFLEKTKIPEE